MSDAILKAVEDCVVQANGDVETTFMASVKQYNDAIKSCKDELFFSDTARFISVDKAPYYAIKSSSRNLGTLGEIHINEKIEVVDKKRMPIDVLYAAGADAGGMYGKAYVDFEGATLVFAYTSDKLAGMNATNKESKEVVVIGIIILRINFFFYFDFFGK